MSAATGGGAAPGVATEDKENLAQQLEAGLALNAKQVVSKDAPVDDWDGAALFKSIADGDARPDAWMSAYEADKRTATISLVNMILKVLPIVSNY